MKQFFIIKQVAIPFSLILSGLLFFAPVYGTQFEEGVSTEEYLFVKGIIRLVSVEDRTVKIKQKTGVTITFSTSEETILEGFYKLKELQPRQKIKVWYRPGESENRALKILKPLELGC